MKKISNLCIYFLLLVLSDAVPLKVIPGERSVVKKDGTTHTISKYYVVPNDFDLNKVNNSSKISIKTTLHVNSNKYSENKDFETHNEDQVSEDKVQIEGGSADDRANISDVAVNTNVINLDTKAEAQSVDNNANDNVAESNVSVNLREGLESEDLGNLQVEPISNSNSLNISNSSTETNLNNTNDDLNVTYTVNATKNINSDDDFILNKFGIAVHESVEQNINNYWKLVKKYIDTVQDEDELLRKVERLSLLLDVFTTLYKSSQSKMPVELMIDNLLDILQTPNGVLNVTENHVKQSKRKCLRKCLRKCALSETDGRLKSDDLHLDHGNLTSIQRRDIDLNDGNVWIKGRSSGAGSNKDVSQLMGSNQPINILQNQLVRPNHLKTSIPLVVVPDGYNTLRSTIVIPHDEPNGNIHKDAVLNPILDSAYTIDDISTDNIPLTIKDKITNDIAWTIEDRKHNNIPSIIKDRTIDNIWPIESERGNLPVTYYQYNGIQSKLGTPYHVYTYVITPSLLYQTPETRSIIKVNSGQYTDNLNTRFGKSYGLSSSHDKNKVVFMNKPSQKYYKSEVRLSGEPEVVLKPSNSKITFGNNVVLNGYNKNQEPNPESLLSGTPQDYNESQLTVENGQDINNNAAFLYPNLASSKSQFDSGLPNSHYKNKLELMNKPSQPYYNSEVRLSKEPRIKINPTNSELIVEKNIVLNGYNSEEANPESLFSDTTQDDYEYKVPVENGQETVNNPELPLLNTASSVSQYDFEPESDVKRTVGVQETRPNDEFLLPNVPSNPNELELNLNIAKDEENTAVKNLDTTDVNPESVFPYSNSNHNDFEIEKEKQTDFNPNLLFKVPSYEPESIKSTEEYNPVAIQGGEIDNRDNFLISNQPRGQTYGRVIKKPTLIIYHYDNPQGRLNYLKHFKLKLAPTYQLFSLDNLLKLHNLLIRSRQINGLNIYNSEELSNLRKIINILLILANHFSENKGSKDWYKNIFYNVQKHRHPLQLYVYNLIRQKWLHELLLALYKNDFNLNVLNSPKLNLLLGTWEFPNYVQNFLDKEELVQDDSDTLNLFGEPLSTQNILQNNIIAPTHNIVNDNSEIKSVLDYVTKYVNSNYRTPNQGIILSIAGINAEPDATAIVEILQKYWQNKNYIESNENAIIRDRQIDMLNKIVLYLRQKGYGTSIIIDLIQKLYEVVNSLDSNICHTHRKFPKKIYDVILPVLRRSG